MLSIDATTLTRSVPAEFSPDEPFFAGLGEPFGPDSLILRIGPLKMRLEGLSRRQTDELVRRFRPFVVEGSGPTDVVIRLHPARVRDFLTMRRDGTAETYRLEMRRSAGRTTLWSYEFAGRLHHATALAELALVDEGGERFDRGLENFLRVMTASFILERDGVLLHASAVVRDGSAHLFFGPSGSGKTTVTQLSPNDIVLSDDLALVVRHNDRFEAAGIPFGMAHHRVPDSAESFPIASLNRLEQGPEVRREPLNGARAVADVVACLPFVMQEKGRSEKALQVVGRLLEEVPVYRLVFRKDPCFWTAIERDAC